MSWGTWGPVLMAPAFLPLSCPQPTRLPACLLSEGLGRSSARCSRQNQAQLQKLHLTAQHWSERGDAILGKSPNQTGCANTSAQNNSRMTSIKPTKGMHLSGIHEVYFFSDFLQQFVFCILLIQFIFAVLKELSYGGSFEE